MYETVSVAALNHQPRQRRTSQVHLMAGTCCAQDDSELEQILLTKSWQFEALSHSDEWC